jgi:ribosomal protein L35
MRSHNLEHKSQKRKRSFRKSMEVAEGGDSKNVLRMLGKR